MARAAHRRRAQLPARGAGASKLSVQGSIGGLLREPSVVLDSTISCMQDTFTLNDGTVVQAADFEFGFALEGKAVTEDENGSLVIEGYASDFDFDRQDEAFETGAFNSALDAYMTNNPVLLYHHRYDTALGQVKEVRLDQKGMWVKAEVDAPEPNTPVADYYRKIKNGTIRGFSVGGKFYRRMTDAGSRIFKCDLREISVTPMPVNQRTLFAVAGKAFENMSEIGTDTEEVKTDDAELEAMMARLDTLAASFEQLEGKASEHPDGYKIAALLMHAQHVHTLATDTKQDAQSDDVKSAASDMADDIKKHVSKLHHLAAKHGPLPNVYGGTIL